MENRIIRQSDKSLDIKESTEIIPLKIQPIRVISQRGSILDKMPMLRFITSQKTGINHQQSVIDTGTLPFNETQFQP